MFIARRSARNAAGANARRHAGSADLFGFLSLLWHRVEEMHLQARFLRRAHEFALCRHPDGVGPV